MFRVIRERWTFAAALLALLCGAAWAQSDVGAVLRRADADARAARYDAARNGYAEALSMGGSLDQDAARAELVGRSYANTNPADLSAAIRYFQSALRLSNGEERVRAELADTQVRAGKYEEAADHYLVLTKAHPSSPIYVIALSRALLQAGRAEDALQQLQPWLIRTPGVTSVRLEFARILSYQKRFFDAKQQYETVLKTEPTNLVAEIGLAKVTSWQGDQEAALPMYERVLTHNPSNYDALVGKAFCLLWMGRQSAALPLLETAIRRNPSDADVREALSHITGASELPPAAATPPSMVDVPAAAPFIEQEAAAPSAAQSDAARRITVPPTRLPEVTAAQRSAGTRAFAPNGSKMPASPSKFTPQKKKSAASAKPETTTKPDTEAEAETEPKPETNVFGFTGMSNAKIVVILTIIVGVLILLLFSVSSRDSGPADRHDVYQQQRAPMPPRGVVKVTRSYRESEVEDEPPPMIEREAPPVVVQTPAAPTPQRNAVARSRPAMVGGDYTLSGIPRQNERERQSTPSAIPRAHLRREPPPSTPAPAPRANLTEIMPRADASMLTDLKLKGLRVLLIGSEERLVEFERTTLEGSGAEVVVEGNWSEAIHRMETAGVHAIVLNEGGGDQTRRIYQAVESQYPGWMKRLLLVLSGDDVPTQHFVATCRARCLMQPFESADFVSTLARMFGRNGASGG